MFGEWWGVVNGCDGAVTPMAVEAEGLDVGGVRLRIVLDPFAIQAEFADARPEMFDVLKENTGKSGSWHGREIRNERERKNRSIRLYLIEIDNHLEGLGIFRNFYETAIFFIEPDCSWISLCIDFYEPAPDLLCQDKCKGKNMFQNLVTDSLSA